jgi:hypothetical protein
MGGKSFRVALACCRSAVRGSWRQAVALALLAMLPAALAARTRPAAELRTE